MRDQITGKSMKHSFAVALAVLVAFAAAAPCRALEEPATGVLQPRTAVETSIPDGPDIHSLDAPSPVRIMPLGDSITRGYTGSSNHTGYRRELYLLLANGGYGVNFVGSLSEGIPDDFDKDHEGWSGYEGWKIKNNVYGWLENNPPHIVLLHIGTNDITDEDPDAAEYVQGILDEIDRYEADYGVHVKVVLALIILREDDPGKKQQTKAFNDTVEAMAQARIASGDDIVVVDMEHALAYPDDLSSDGVHPNDTGYAKMAGVWWNALDQILQPTLIIEMEGNGSGDVVPSPDTPHVYDYGEQVQLTATPSEGSAFSRWEGDVPEGSRQSNPVTLEMFVDRGVTAIFTRTDGFSVEPTQGSVGTELAIDGHGFGEKKGKVKIGDMNCKILAWSDTYIQCRIRNKKEAPGMADVAVKPKNGVKIVEDGAFDLMPPRIDWVNPPNGSKGSLITVHGAFFGTKEGKVRLIDGTGRRKRCHIVSGGWTDAAITFKVPGKVSGTCDLEVKNKISSVTETDAFTVD